MGLPPPGARVVSGGFWITLGWLLGLLAYTDGPRVTRKVAWLLYGAAVRAREGR